MDNSTQQTKRDTQGEEKKPCVEVKKDEVIEVLKTLEGVKRKLQALLKA